MARRRKALAPKGRDDDVRWVAGFALGSILTVIIILVVIIAPPATIGPSEGELAPDFSADSYSGANWINFKLSDTFDYEWNEGEQGEWILIQFIDTDCPYCWSEGETMSNLHAQWSNDVEFITIAVELSINGHDSNQQEIEAFRDKTNYGTDDNDGNGCNSGRDNCANRPGTSHNWNYVEATSAMMKDWEVTGTPFLAILQPDGYVAWNQYENTGETIEDAMQRIVGGTQ
jgi:thiol-disulfide isomerase/thioredoxin|tara:strand:- start:769 stop:1458 length:690 start_codon:yes stop_codon:yes gene_type:complete